MLTDAKSHFSIGESILTPTDIADEAARLGYTAAALCDVMSISGMPEFTKACDKHGIKPIVGVRLRIVPTIDKVEKQFTVYPKLYILTEEGFRIVTNLLSLAYDDDHFYGVPRLTFDDLLSALDDASGHVAYSTGSLYSASRLSDVSSVTKHISERLTRSLTFSELVPGNSAVWDRQASVAYSLANELDLPLLLGRPALYTAEDGHVTLDLMNAIARNFKSSLRDVSSHLQDYRAINERGLVAEAVQQIKRLEAWGEPVDTARFKAYRTDWSRLVDAVTFKWSKHDVSLPKMAEDEDAELRRLAKEGLKERLKATVFGYKPPASEVATYVDRLKYELDVLTGMGFSGYFLLTREIVMWSKSNGILVGPGRGSVGGSLVAYVLGITDVDPLRFGLIFERFINPERIDLPDADLDFMSTRRHEVFDHIRETYGEDRVANISNYATLGSRAVLQDLGRILEDFESQGMTKHIPMEQGTAIDLVEALDQVPEVAAFAERKPELWKTALALEGKMRTLSVHAAGVVVAGEKLTNRAVVEKRKGLAVVNWDKNVVEDMGLVKLDILGLSTLDLIAIALRKIKERHGVDLDLNAIPLDDEDVLHAFGTGKTIGVFQFESGGMRKLLKSLYTGGGGRISFDEISATTALYRPGPMESGLMDDYVNIKSGYSSETYEHPAMRAALEETYSVIVYQEQVMRIAQDLCGFTMAQADHLRKAIGKKDAKKMAEQGEAFINGAIASGMDEVIAKQLWDKIVLFAGYAFNKSHSVEYTLISYQSMWLKVKYPVEFYAAALSILADKRPQLVKDANAAGIKVLPPDVNLSTNEFEILNDTALIAPLSVINGVSDRGVAEIMAARDKGGFLNAKDFQERVPARVINKTVREKLDRVGAFARIEAQIPSDHPDRRPDQLELIPDIMVGGAIVNREVMRDKITKTALLEMLKDFRDTEESCKNAVFVAPRMGKNARFMVVFDGPGYHDEQAGRFATNGVEAIAEALEEAGLDFDDAYWTGLCKVPKRKGEKLYGPEVLHASKPLFEKELMLLNPQVVLCLGTNAARHFDPGMKGAITDHAGKVIYMKPMEGLKDDRNVVIGITPGMIYFDASKQTMLNDAFKIVAEMFD
ncbi:MAG: DNA polymerase III subunit alpha [Rhodobacterales bacterium]|nr:DNA polymerase III subunit alpha [Rhodobacterales bacterium]